MGEETKIEKLRHFIGHIGWKLFIWAYYYGSEEQYFREINEEDGLCGVPNCGHKAMSGSVVCQFHSENLPF